MWSLCRTQDRVLRGRLELAQSLPVHFVSGLLLVAGAVVVQQRWSTGARPVAVADGDELADEVLQVFRVAVAGGLDLVDAVSEHEPLHREVDLRSRVHVAGVGSDPRTADD
eukprot:2680584-Prymnesium_polylepis.1